MNKHIAESFQQYFEMVPATTESLKEAVYRLRYQIYCLETGFEDPEQFPDGLERDEYDDSSEHYLIRHRETGAYAATTRLILPDPDRPQRLFPIERRARLDQTKFPDNVLRSQLAEASRFCVSKDFKRRRGEQGTTTGVHVQNLRDYRASEDDRRTSPYLTLALLACLVRMSTHHGITHWYAFMETSLIRLFSILGIYWTVIGPITKFHGRRQPCIIEVAELHRQVKKRNIQVWDMLTDHGKYLQDGADVARPDLGSLNSERVASASVSFAKNRARRCANN